MRDRYSTMTRARTLTVQLLRRVRIKGDAGMMTRTVLSIFAIIAFGVSIVTAQNTAATRMEAARKTAIVDGDLDGAIKQYQAIVETYAKTDRAAAATALVRLADGYQKLGRAAESQAAYERVVREFSDQSDAVSEARARLASVQSPAGSESRQTPRRIWAGKDHKDFGPTVPSPDDRYSSYDGPTGDVFVRDLRTGVDRRVTEGADWVSEYTGTARISPDGRLVAYDWYIHKENAVELRIASLGAGEPVRPRTVFRGELNAGVYMSAWMPDGRQLLVLREHPGRTWQIGIVTIEDGSFRGIKSLEWRKPNMLSSSPDGRFIAYDVPEGEAGSPLDIFLLATDGGQEAVLRNPANDSFPLWSADGSRLVFLSDRTGSNALWTVSIRDGRPNAQPSLIRSDVGSMTPLGVTRSGSFYYQSITGGLRNLYVTDLDNAQVTKMPVPATERLVNVNVGPAWSRDGEHLAYYSFRDTFDGSNGMRLTAASIRLLVIRSRKTGEERTVPLPPRVAFSVSRCCFWGGPKWFPDNRSVLIELGDAQGPGFGFYRLAIDTGNTELLAHVPRTAVYYDLSPDGRNIFYTVGLDDRMALMRFDIETRRESELKNIPCCLGEFLSLAVSPDGLQLAMVLGGPAGAILEVMPSAGGQPRQVFRPGSLELDAGAPRHALAWTPDQRFLLWVRGDDRSLWKVPAAGGQAEKVGLPMENIKNLAVHPDGRQFVFDAATEAPTREIWALENFLSR
jgi:Tol biopolymer transport system component